MMKKKLTAVTELKNKGHFDFMTQRLPRGPVDERPMEKTVGLDDMLVKVWGLVKDENVGRVGIHGMGGVGKTTLLKKISNEFLKPTHDFDVIIFVVVSRPASVEKIQDVILRRLGIEEKWLTGRTEYEKSTEVLRLLKEKKFVLLLDDIWERIDLTEVGVPPRDNPKKSKVIFTIRSVEVCNGMGADRVMKMNKGNNDLNSCISFKMLKLD
uniref:AAA+ ATPase domain-containing protein n=1 Tax=Davidia involucrata TaxID=16924 RepID=A0A5B7B8N8_DAVIN